ncbi:MAG: glycoside hydrolase family 3 C-terminal domain-containing protein [Eubacterium sp.]|nr:glycoside hydrolase family 3 C-terminal domain-containing protein [Eubacterium sp.]
MKKWTRAKYMPNKPLYEGRPYVTASREHLDLSRQAAREGMVLLKNENNVLPFAPGRKVAIFGKALFDYVKGGGGSGDVSVAYVHNLYDGFRMHKDTIEMYEPLVNYYKDYVEKEYDRGALPGLMAEAELSDDQIEGAAAFTDTALIVISRFSGEGWDRKTNYYESQLDSERELSEASEAIFGESDYYLTDKERKMISMVKSRFSRIAVVLNVGGVMDTSWFAADPAISAVLLSWQGGMEGGLATADLLLGAESPSGKLPDTFADSLEAYPSTEGFHESHTYVNYTDDIYVGYRYFETMSEAQAQVNYPFGFGLSYTSFEIETILAGPGKCSTYLLIKVKNTGSRPGKEVVQIYVEAPAGKLGKPSRALVDFAKTRELAPGEDQLLSFKIPYYAFASFDDLGKIQKSAYVLEEGIYRFYVGNSVRDAACIDYQLHIEKDRIIQQLSSKCSPEQLGERMRSDGTMEELPQRQPNNYMENVLGWSDAPIEGIMPPIRGRGHKIPDSEPEGHIDLMDVAEGRADLEAFMDQLSDLELADLLGGQPNRGIANTYGFGNNENYGIPSLMTTDGPAGVRILPDYEIYTTAWPCATQLASSWNREVLGQMGRVAGEEVRENNLYIWLAPAVNIHRNPLCGRNFEYYSEDPVLAGELAAALIRGVQSTGAGATVKHFACNNKETNRKESDSRISERALREIYLKQFEIIIKKASPWAVMSSYNLINGVRASENKELLEGILRDEWGYEGVVCSDWYTHGEHYKELLAGNDIKMGCGYPERLLMALEKGAISREDMIHSVRRVLKLILKAD